MWRARRDSNPQLVVRREEVAARVISQWVNVTGEENGTKEAAKW
jgi:hypothetical protein